MNSILCDERKIMIFLNCFHDNIYTSCVLLEPECIQAHWSFYLMWHMIKLKPNLTEMALARHKKVMCRGISMSSLFLWPTVSQRNGLIQWYEQHVSVWTIIMVFSHIISSLQISTRYSISVPTYFLRSIVIKLNFGINSGFSVSTPDFHLILSGWGCENLIPFWRGSVSVSGSDTHEG